MYTKGSLIKNSRGIVDKIKKISLSTLSDDDLLLESNKLREEALAGASADGLLVRAYALVKEATKRALELKVFDVQLLGAIALNNKKIIEMSTG